jgi:hypothetical protein
LKFWQEEKLTAAGYSKCDICNENTMNRSVINLGRLPRVLCLSLKRFRMIIPPPPIPTKDTKRMQAKAGRPPPIPTKDAKRKQAEAAQPRLERCNHAVTYGDTLTLSGVPDSASPTDRVEVKYDLVAVCHHYAKSKLSGGHYYATCRLVRRRIICRCRFLSACADALCCVIERLSVHECTCMC